ncbi:hypothetical protein AAE250_16380 [Bacteroides sp. GD17]|uniref:hypothetical protein n=1 Tax=Bacteroides sp. GD17 TaxID=3139826 RepID=UPI00313B93DC
MIETIQVSDSSVINSISEKFPNADIGIKGGLAAGRYGSIGFGDISLKAFVIELASKSLAELVISTGSYTNPVIVGIAMGMSGGASSGLPYSLYIKTLCGVPCISSGQAFHRYGKNYIQIALTNSISWSRISFFSLHNIVNSISIDGSMEYNAATDTNLVNGSVG